MSYQPKSYRQFVATAVTLHWLVFLLHQCKCIGFVDIKNNSHKEAILALVDQGIIKGYPDGTFRPYQYITRGDAAVMVARALGLLNGKEYLHLQVLAI